MLLLCELGSAGFGAHVDIYRTESSRQFSGSSPVREGCARTCRSLIPQRLSSLVVVLNAPRCCLPIFKRILSLDDFGYESAVVQMY